MENVDIAALLLRVCIGGTMAAHGWNHAYGGGKIPGTAGWFESMGLRHGRLNAWFASINEMGAGALLVVGLANPLAAAGVIGSVAVAFVIAHARNGFFIFRAGQGYEYVLVLAVTALAIGALGPGRVSLDHALGIAEDFDGWLGLAIAAIGGFGGAALVLMACWRPERAPASSA